MKILFHDNSLNNRGTSVALFDYAYYNEELLGNESIVSYEINNSTNDIEVINKFKKHFKVIPNNGINDLTDVVKREGVDVVYFIKSGEKNHQIVPNVKNIIHSVFNSNPVHKHGDVYATVSEWLSSMSNYEIPYVPHMINLPNLKDDLRTELGIPENQIVIGRYGGYDSFDIPFVTNSINKCLSRRNDVTFLFMNTPRFINHTNVKFLPSSADLDYKTKFINTCDVMIHARRRGETFGLAVLEFATKNKRIVTFGSSPEKSHLTYLRNNCDVYNNENELDNILNNITKTNPYNTVYLNDIFSPKNVMDKFQKIFLNG